MAVFGLVLFSVRKNLVTLTPREFSKQRNENSKIQNQDNKIFNVISPLGVRYNGHIQTKSGCLIVLS